MRQFFPKKQNSLGIPGIDEKNGFLRAKNWENVFVLFGHPRLEALNL